MGSHHGTRVGGFCRHNMVCLVRRGSESKVLLLEISKILVVVDIYITWTLQFTLKHLHWHLNIEIGIILGHDFVRRKFYILKGSQSLDMHSHTTHKPESISKLWFILAHI